MAQGGKLQSMVASTGLRSARAHSSCHDKVKPGQQQRLAV